MAFPESPTREQVFDALCTMSVLELIGLTKSLEDRWGIRADAIPMPGAYPLPLIVRDSEERTEFDVVLVETGPRKIEVIKTLRELTRWGLKECKDFVESSHPQTIRADVPKAEAEALRAQFEAAGAKVELR